MTNWGIDIHDKPDQFRVSIPPVTRISSLPSSYRRATLAWLTCGGLVFTSVAMAAPTEGGNLAGVIPPLVEFVIVGAIIVSMAWYRMNRQLTIELSAHWLSLLNGDGQPTRRWRRADLIEIKANRFNGKLVVRARDQEMGQLFIGADRDMAVFVAEQLRAALTRPAAHLPQPAPAGDPVPAEPAPAPPPAAPFSSGQITIGLALVTIATIVLIAVAFVSPTLGCVLIGGCVLAAIPLGIRLGTQDKDIWV
jgi:hypothetical protein